VLVSAGSSPQLLVCDLDIGGLEAVRKALPVLNNRAVIAQTGRIASR
jgi:predicted amidohydrolase